VASQLPRALGPRTTVEVKPSQEGQQHGYRAVFGIPDVQPADSSFTRRASADGAAFLPSRALHCVLLFFDFCLPQSPN